MSGTPFPRPSHPRLWRAATLAGVAVGTVLAGPALAQVSPPALPHAQTPLWHVAGEAGEGGEGGAVVDAAPDLAYLVRLALVESHLAAAVDLYALGQADQAIALSGHPEAELLGDLTPAMLARGAPDLQPQIDTVTEAMFDYADLARVSARLNDIRHTLADASTLAQPGARLRLDALTRLVRAAAGEYAGNLDHGRVTDPAPWLEAHEMVTLARSTLAAMASNSDPAVQAATAKALSALAATDPAFDGGDGTFAVNPELLWGAAARIELAIANLR